MGAITGESNMNENCQTIQEVLVFTFTIRRGRRYKATISLGFLQSFASNEAIGDKFRTLGFTEVAVTGEGENRTVEGLWPLADVTAPLPPEIIGVTEV